MFLNEEAGTETQQGWTYAKLFVLIVPIIATVSVLRLWFGPPLAWGLSTFGWTLLGFWLPSQPRVPYLKWMFISLLFAIATSLLAAILQL
jgi:hypothetical protein